MTIAYLSLGSNVGNRRRHLLYAISRLRADVATTEIQVASFYITEPVGGVVQDNFLNTAVRIDTRRSADSLLAFIHQIEQQQHRHRFIHWGPRTLDLDIIFYGDAHIQTETLTIPHPEAKNRRFVLTPIAELAPDKKAVSKQVKAWLAVTPDQTKIIKLA